MTIYAAGGHPLRRHSFGHPTIDHSAIDRRLNDDAEAPNP